MGETVDREPAMARLERLAGEDSGSGQDNYRVVWVARWKEIPVPRNVGVKMSYVYGS